MRRIYTKTGDRGTTGIHGGERVPKDDIRIEANGCLDELNCQIGIVRSLLEAAHDWQTIVQTIQQELMVAMSLVATPSAIRERNPNQFSGQVVAACEREMDRLMPLIEDKDYFILPGGTPIAAQLRWPAPSPAGPSDASGACTGRIPCPRRSWFSSTASRTSFSSWPATRHNNRIGRKSVGWLSPTNAK